MLLLWTGIIQCKYNLFKAPPLDKTREDWILPCADPPSPRATLSRREDGLGRLWVSVERTYCEELKTRRLLV